MKHTSLFLIIALLYGCFGKEAEKTKKEGEALPEFKILLTDSVTWLNIGKIPAGKPLVLFYFSPYCPYCKVQTQEIIEEMEELHDLQFYFVTDFPLPDLKKFNKAYQLAKYPNIITGIDTTQFIHNYFEVKGIPYIAIYGRDKKLKKSFMGKITGSQLKKVAEE
jgi:thiol-disulfide isomerase/thioredoxin